MSAPGAQPQGATTEQSASAAVQSMFNAIAPSYDRLNHILSCNIDRLWWRKTARTFHTILQQPQAQILDLCCGTGDLTLALLRHRPAAAAPVLAVDFARAMLERAEKKLPPGRATLLEADALHLPVADNSADLLTVAFGFRNLANYTAGLQEMHRVLRAGGEVGILDFSEPDGWMGKLYQIYFRRVLPRIGAWISGASSAYEYLPESVHRFPPPQQMLAMMRQCGFANATWTPYTFGIAGLYRGVKA